MKRFALLAAILVGGGLSAAVSAVQQPQQPPAGQKPRVVEVEKLKDNLFMLKGGGGNTAVFVTAKGVVVVDTKNPGWGAPLIDKIRELTDKPITTIINTHSHGDHVSGNVEFEPSVDVVVQANTAENMKKMATPPGMDAATPPAQTIFEQNGGRGLPKRTFKDTMTIGSGADADRSALFRPRPHQRRRVDRVPGAARDARRRHLLRQEHSRSSTRTTAAAASRCRTR